MADLRDSCHARACSLRKCLSAAAFAACLCCAPAVRADVIFVDLDAEPGGNGQTWQTAFDDLQDALAAAQAGDEIWVAEGMYRPAPPNGDREASFNLVSGAGLYGGFNGTEEQRDQRDPQSYVTTLSGDLNGDDGPEFANNDENSYHVVTAIGTGEGTVLDGFTVAGGNANGPGIHHLGGGLYNQGGRLKISNCAIQYSFGTWGGGIFNGGDTDLSNCALTSNAAVSAYGNNGCGGAVCNRSARLAVTGCQFVGNLSSVFGGAMFSDSTSHVVSDCVFMDNHAAYGGAWENEYSPSTMIVDSLFQGNYASYYGGGLSDFNDDLTATDCEFTGNEAELGGGGLYYRANERGRTATLDDCVFTNNTSRRGGGIEMQGGFNVRFRALRCRLVSNSATDYGGAIYLRTDSPILANCQYFGNNAGHSGGAMFNYEANATMVNCVLSGNSAGLLGGGMHSIIDSSIVLINCTLSGNRAGDAGGGMNHRSDSHPTLFNTILWGNEDAGGTDESAQIHFLDSAPRIHYSCIQGWTGDFGGTGNIGTDPLLVDPDGPDDTPGTEDDDLRLSPRSPAIDAGINAGMPPDVIDADGDEDEEERVPVDLEGMPRFGDVEGVPDTGDGAPPLLDMGAFEHVDDCNSNGVPDDRDIRRGRSLDCNDNGVPDECEPSQDCNDNHVCDADDVRNGTSEDCNGNLMPDECEADCNGNQAPDDCDITQGVSADCNEDGVPDECLTSRLDCNDNDLVDECETREGVTPDENQNGRPDECEPRVLFVHPHAEGKDNGTSWADAFTEARDALVVAAGARGFVEEVWIAAGTYTPAPVGGSRHASFRLSNGVGVYGGFAGGETRREERDPKTNETVLSGDINGDDVGGLHDTSKLDNTFHVVISKDTDNTAVLDGFTITAAHTEPLSNIERDRGGGMWNNGAPLLSNLVFSANWAVGSGGGLFTYGNPTLANCVFVDNVSDVWGGGMFNDGVAAGPVSASPTLQNCQFVGNSGSRGGGVATAWDTARPLFVDCRFVENTARHLHGGGLYIDNNCHATVVNGLFLRNRSINGGGMRFLNADSTMINCLFVENVASELGGGVFGSSSRFGHDWTNCIFWGNSDSEGIGESSQISGYLSEVRVNYTCIQGWTGQLGGVGNFGDDPLFVDPENGDYRLRDGSPCIDAGDNEAVPEGIETDLDGNRRFVDDPATPDTGNCDEPCPEPGIVDIGPYEFHAGGGCTGIEKLSAKCRPQGERNKIAAKLKRAEPGAAVTFRLDDDPDSDVRTTVGDNGRARAKFRRVPDGRHAVETIECGIREETRCG